MTKAYTYGGPSIGVHSTRHDAIGHAAIMGREYSDNIHAPFWGPKDVLHYVGAIPDAVCGFCGEVFDYEAELDEHTPCSHYEPLDNYPEKSNPIEAARMTRYGL